MKDPLLGRIFLLIFRPSIKITITMNVVESIQNSVTQKFAGRFDSEQQRADLFVYIDGVDQTIVAVDTQMIYFEDEKYNTSLYDADIQHLVYLDRPH